MLFLSSNLDVLKTSPPKLIFNQHWGRCGGKIGAFTLGPSGPSVHLDISGQLADRWTWSSSAGWRFAQVLAGRRAKLLSVLVIPLLHVHCGAQCRRGWSQSCPVRGSEKHSSLSTTAGSPTPTRGKGYPHFPSHTEGLWHVGAPRIPG